MNQAQGLTSLYLIKDTEMDEEKFRMVFQKDNIVGAKFEVTLSDKSVHKFDVGGDILDMLWDSFENGEKATDGKISDQITMKQ
jgi:hypothetical protein